MFKITRKADFAIRGMFYLGSHQVGRASLDEIAEAEAIPKPFLGKILQAMSKKGLIRSLKGPSGGFMLLRPIDNIALLDVIEAVEGEISLNRCLVEGGGCPKNGYCAAHTVWMECQEGLISILKGHTIRTLVDREQRSKVAQ
jgi:Rrf2 family protein